MKKLIVNADDLGFSRAVNRAILEGVAFGTVTAASLMVNMPFAAEAVENVQKQCSGLSLGLHFTLTSGKPVTVPDEIPLLVDDKGFFKHGFPDLWKNLVVPHTKIEFLRQVRTEFQAQLEQMHRLVRTHGLRFDHLDSHQHIHVLPGLLTFFQQAAKEHDLSLRIPREAFCSTKRFFHRFHAWLPGGILKRFLLNRNTAHVREQKIGYFGILETGKIDKTAIRAILRSVGSKSLKWEVFELNIHPSKLVGLQEAEKNDLLCASRDDLTFHRSVWRQKEFETLTDPEVLDLFKQYNVCPVGFGNQPLTP